MKKYLAFVAILSLLLTSIAVQANFTYKFQKSGGGSKKHCYVTFEIDLNGKWTSTALYSNGQKLKGVRFFSDLTVRAKDGKEIMVVSQNHHVQHRGKTQEETSLYSGTLNSKIAQLVSEEMSSVSCSTRDDNITKAINDAAQAVRVAAWVAGLIN